MPGPLDDIINQLRAKHGPNWEALVGLPVPQPVVPPAGQQGGPRTAADFNEMARSGVADLSFGNLGRAFGNAAGVMGPGAVSMGLQGMGHVAAPRTFGSPLSTMTGYASVPNPQIRQAALDQMRDQLGRARDAAYAGSKMRGTSPAGSSGGHGRGGFGSAGGRDFSGMAAHDRARNSRGD